MKIQRHSRLRIQTGFPELCSTQHCISQPQKRHKHVCRIERETEGVIKDSSRERKMGRDDHGHIWVAFGKKGRTFLPLRYELNKEMILSRREGSKREYSPDG